MRRNRKFWMTVLVSTVISVMVMFSASAEPKLTGTPQNLTVAGTRCLFGTFGCSSSTRRLLLQTNEAIPAIQLISLDLNRADGADVFPASAIQAKLPANSIRPDQPLSIPIEFNFEAANYGEFSGELLVVHSAGEFRIPIIVRVKEFWLLPLVVLLLGVVLGLGISRYRAEGIPRDEAVVQIGRLRNQMRADAELAQSFVTKINANLVDVDTALEAKRWDAVQQSISLAQTTWDKWRKYREDWLVQLKYVNQLNDRFEQGNLAGDIQYLKLVQNQINNISRNLANQESPQQLQENLEEVKQKIDRYLQAAGQLDELNERVNSLRDDRRWKERLRRLQSKLERLSPQDVEAFNRWQEEFETEAAELDQAVYAEAPSAIASDLATTRGSINASGSLIEPVPLSNISPELVQVARQRIKVFGIVSYAIATLLLVGLGFRQLYLNNPIFGSNGFSDYFSLLAWGFGAEVTRESVTQVIRDSKIPGLSFGPNQTAAKS